MSDLVVEVDRRTDQKGLLSGRLRESFDPAAWDDVNTVIRCTRKDRSSDTRRRTTRGHHKQKERACLACMI